MDYSAFVKSRLERVLPYVLAAAFFGGWRTHSIAAGVIAWLVLMTGLGGLYSLLWLLTGRHTRERRKVWL
jgi:hypothetical protein